MSNFTVIPLTQGFEAIIDKEDYELISEHSWYVKHRTDDLKYAYSRIYGKLISMHSFLMDTPPDGMEIDHINDNGLDNRRSNLRFISHNENLHHRRVRLGTSGYVGVFKNGSNWMARISLNGKPRYLGTYKTKEEAAMVYDETAEELYGAEARTNKKLGLIYDA